MIPVDERQWREIAKRILRELGVLSEAVRAIASEIRQQGDIDRTIISELRRLSTTFAGIQNQVEAVAKQYQAAKEKEDPTPEIRAIRNSLQGIQAKQRTANDSQGRYQNRDLYASWAGVLILLGYTLVNFGMLCAMRAANKSANESFTKTLCQMQAQTAALRKAAALSQTSLDQNTNAFEVDEQARIKLTSREFGWENRWPFNVNTLFANYHYSNIGKTPAKIIGIDKHVSAIKLRMNPNGVSVRTEDFTFMPQLPVKGPEGSPLYASDDRLFTVFNHPFPESDIPAVQNGKKVIVAWGCIEYRDIFGTLHWTDFCDIREPPPDDKTFGECSYQCQRERKSE